MRKVASPQDLQIELRRLLAYAQTDRPSRTKLALELRSLASRVAAPKINTPQDVERVFEEAFSATSLLEGISEDWGFDPDLAAFARKYLVKTHEDWEKARKKTA